MSNEQPAPEFTAHVHVVTGTDQFPDVTKAMATEARLHSSKMKPLLVKSYIGDFHGCGHWRVLYPTILISSIREDVKCVYDFAFHAGDQSVYQGYDLLIMQRQVQPGFEGVMEHFNKVRDENKLPVVAMFEIDDWLFGIPKYNMAHNLYDNVLGHEHLAKILRSFDGMIVSTRYLKKMYSKYVPNDRIWVVQNHMPRMLWDFPEARGKEDYAITGDKPRILFAGGANRFAVDPKDIPDKDDITVLEPLIRRTLDEFTWVFMGAKPLRLMDLFNERHIEHVPWESNLNYPRALRDKVQADLAISPLIDNAFNRSKSNIKILEYGAVGIPGIYTNLVPYDELPDFMKVRTNTTASWEKKIREFLGDEKLRLDAQKAQLKVLEEYWLEDNLDKITDIYKDIVETIRKKRKLIT